MSRSTRLTCKSSCLLYTSRDGREIYFAPEKITRAIFLAASKVAEDEGQVANYATAEQLTDQVVNYLNRHYQDGIPTVEEIQDLSLIHISMTKCR